MDKFLRSYVLTVETISGRMLTIEPPFTVEFDIQRNILTSANVCSIRIYNLSERNRNQILKDQYTYDDLRKVTLQAGYGSGPNYPVIFRGEISRAWSVREGVNFITQIECFDGGFAFINATSNFQFPDGTTQQNVAEALIASLAQYNVTRGAIGEIPGELSRGASYTGNTIDVLRELTGGAFFIDNGKANVLSDSECLRSTQIQVISSASGLLGTPVREQTVLHFDILFEPRLAIGQQIRLDSITAANYNTFYKVVSLKHRGMISDAVCGSATTTVGVFVGTEALSSVGTV